MLGCVHILKTNDYMQFDILKGKSSFAYQVGRGLEFEPQTLFVYLEDCYLGRSVSPLDGLLARSHLSEIHTPVEELSTACNPIWPCFFITAVCLRRRREKTKYNVGSTGAGGSRKKQMLQQIPTGASSDRDTRIRSTVAWLKLFLLNAWNFMLI